MEKRTVGPADSVDEGRYTDVPLGAGGSNVGWRPWSGRVGRVAGEVEGAQVRGVLLSFDIDGTLEDGDPPGPVSIDVVRRAIGLGYVVGSASDRTLRDQANVWSRRGIEPHFVSHKHTLEAIALRFPAVRRVHVGDTNVDDYYARLAGFEFVFAPAATEDPDWVETLSLSADTAP